MARSAAEEATVTDLILGMKEVLAKKGYESDSSNSISFPSNRGRKLKRKARFVQEGQLDLPTGPKTYKETVYVDNKVRSIIHRKKRQRTEDDSEDSEESETSEEEDDPYAEVDIQKILGPISNPADLPTHPGLSVPYKRRDIERIIEECHQILIDQHNHTSVIKNLLTTFLGDDDEVLLGKMQQDPGMPRYEYGAERIAEDTGKEFSGFRPRKSATPEHSEDEGIGLGLMNGNGESLIPRNHRRDDSETPSNHDTLMHNAPPLTSLPISRVDGLIPPHHGPNGIHTPNPTSPQSLRTLARAAPDATSPITTVDPFFIPPYNPIDKTFGLPPQEAAETMRLLLGASQRQDEVLRGLSQTREMLMKASRLKRTVWEQARSMEGYRARAQAKGMNMGSTGEDWGELTDGEDWFDGDEWGVEEELQKGAEEEEEIVERKTTRGRRRD